MSASTVGSPHRARHLHHARHTPIFRYRWHVLAAAVALVGVAVVMTVLVANGATLRHVQRVDDAWLRLMDRLRSRPLTTSARWVSFAGATVVSWSIRGVVFLSLALRRRWRLFAAFLTAVVLSELCIGPVKALVDRPRPPGPLIGTSGASYPSGHAIATAVTTIGIALAVAHGRRRISLMVVAAVFSLAMAMSRTYLHAHWLSDVIGGAAIGAGLGLGVPLAFDVVRARRLPGGEAAEPG